MSPQEILPLHPIQKSLATGVLEIPQREAISDPGLSLPAELYLFEKDVYCRTDSETRVIFERTGNDESGCELI
jgi:hypothetical protein